MWWKSACQAYRISTSCWGTPISHTYKEDISFAVNKTCQYMHAPTAIHWCAMKHILRYLKHTIDYDLVLSLNSPTVLPAYSDSDSVGCVYTIDLLVGSIFSWVITLSLGVVASKQLLFGHPRNLNTKPWLTPPRNSRGFNLFCSNFVS